MLTMKSPPLDAQSAETLALNALAWVIGEPEMGSRFLAISGLDPADLRAAVESRALLAGVLAFLLAHEPSLIACAQALGVPPDRISQAHRLLQETA
jgi:hypothetical protein